MEEPIQSVDGELTFWGAHKFLLLIALSIAIALALVGISMTLYATSGAAQLDLSRPGYRGVTSQAISSDSGFQNYPNTGPINSSSVNEFKTLYEKQAATAKVVDAFAGDPLNPDALEISASSTPTQ
jgi:hypothetical protein